MYLCDRGHDEVCYNDGNRCPVCAEKKASASLEVEISDQGDEIERLEVIIHELGQEERSD